MTMLAKCGAWLIDLIGQRCILLRCEDTGLVLRPDGVILLLPEIESEEDPKGIFAAQMLLTIALCKQIETIGSNPTMYDSLIDAGLVIGMPWHEIDTIARGLCRLPPQQIGPLLGDPVEPVETKVVAG